MRTLKLNTSIAGVWGHSGLKASGAAYDGLPAPTVTFSHEVGRAKIRQFGMPLVVRQWIKQYISTTDVTMEYWVRSCLVQVVQSTSYTDQYWNDLVTVELTELQYFPKTGVHEFCNNERCSFISGRYELHKIWMKTSGSHIHFSRKQLQVVW